MNSTIRRRTKRVKRRDKEIEASHLDSKKRRTRRSNVRCNTDKHYNDEAADSTIKTTCINRSSFSSDDSNTSTKNKPAKEDADDEINAGIMSKIVGMNKAAHLSQNVVIFDPLAIPSKEGAELLLSTAANDYREMAIERVECHTIEQDDVISIKYEPGAANDGISNALNCHFSAELTRIMKRTSNSSEVESEGSSPLAPLCVVQRPKRKGKPKVKDKWTTDDVRSLIHAVEKFPCIWDYASADHKILNKRYQAWRYINKKLGKRYGAVQCKAKWNSVKITFNKNKLKTQCQGAKPHTPHWEFWADMQFIFENESTNHTISESNVDFDLETDSSTAASTSRSTGATGTSVANGEHRIELPTAQRPAPIVDTAVKRAVDVLDAAGDDEWQIFGNYLASQLRRFNKCNPRIANRIHRAVSRCILDGLEELDAPPKPKQA